MKKKYGSYHPKDIQRALKDLRKEGWIKMKGKKYTLAEKKLINTAWSSHLHSNQLLNSLLKLHTPLVNDLEENVKSLVNLFGSYVFITLMEIGRPFDDDSYRHIAKKPMTIDEKNRFIENLLKKILQTQRLYQVFLETFLNQPNDNMIKSMKELKFLEKRDGSYIFVDEDGKEYSSPNRPTNLPRYMLEDGREYIPESSDFTSTLKRVPLSITPLNFEYSNSADNGDKFYYELDSVTYEHVNNAFSKLNPQAYDRYLNSIWGGLGGGVKEDLGNDLPEAIS